MFLNLLQIFKREFKSKQDIIDEIKKSITKNIINNDSIHMIEAVIHLTDFTARDIMIPRHQIDTIDINDNIENIINKIKTTGHSRFPVIDKEISKIIGIFHSKDLVGYFTHQDEFHIKNHLRKALFVPEIKKLNSLMHEMRLNHSHLVMVVDEFTNIVGIVTLEMIIEQIVGDIEDEYDSIDGERTIIELKENEYRIKGYCKLNELERKLGIKIEDKIVETIGGYIIKKLGRLPVNNEKLKINNCNIEVISADSRKINFIKLYTHRF